MMEKKIQRDIQTNSERNPKQISLRNPNKLQIPAFSTNKLKNRLQWGESMKLKVCRWLDEKWPQSLPKYIRPKLINPSQYI